MSGTIRYKDDEILRHHLCDFSSLDWSYSREEQPDFIALWREGYDCHDCPVSTQIYIGFTRNLVRKQIRIVNINLVHRESSGREQKHLYSVLETKHEVSLFPKRGSMSVDG